jgi:hypothetical protein
MRPEMEAANPDVAADAEIPVCKKLRTKMYFVVGREHVDLRRSGPTAQYWCATTAYVLGPDDVLCCPEVCQPGRACFEPE